MLYHFFVPKLTNYFQFQRCSKIECRSKKGCVYVNSSNFLPIFRQLSPVDVQLFLLKSSLNAHSCTINAYNKNVLLLYYDKCLKSDQKIRECFKSIQLTTFAIHKEKLNTALELG